MRWKDQPYGSDLIGTPDGLDGLLRWVRSETGLRLKITVHGGGCPDPERAAREVAQVATANRDAVLMLEAVNEGNLPRDKAIACAGILTATGIPTAVGWGNQGIDDVKAVGNEAGTNVDVMHLERTDPSARRDRQCWDLHHFTRAIDNGEFAGPGSSVAQETSIFHLCMQRIGSILMGGESYCLHTGSGVYGVSYQGPTSWRYANLWDVPNFAAMCQALRTVDASIGHPGVGSWPIRTNTNIPLEVVSGQVDKQYYAQSSAGDVLGILTDTKGTLSFRQNQSMKWFELRHPETGAVVGADAGLNGYLVRGQLA